MLTKKLAYSCLAHVKKGTDCDLLEEDELGAYVTVYGSGRNSAQFAKNTENALLEMGFDIIELKEFFQLDLSGQEEELQKIVNRLMCGERIIFDTFNAYTAENDTN